jgi:hypothetical protein
MGEEGDPLSHLVLMFLSRPMLSLSMARVRPAMAAWLGLERERERENIFVFVSLFFLTAKKKYC